MRNKPQLEVVYSEVLENKFGSLGGFIDEVLVKVTENALANYALDRIPSGYLIRQKDINSFIGTITVSRLMTGGSKVKVSVTRYDKPIISETSHA